MRTLLFLAALLLASPAYAQLGTVQTLGPYQYSPYGGSYYYRATPYYGGYGGYYRQERLYEQRRIRRALEDIEFNQRWDGFNRGR